MIGSSFQVRSPTRTSIVTGYSTPVWGDFHLRSAEKTAPSLLGELSEEGRPRTAALVQSVLPSFARMRNAINAAPPSRLAPSQSHPAASDDRSSLDHS